MADTVEYVEWHGTSGRSYEYHIYDISFDPESNQDGNYIFAKQIPNGWEAVYVGEGDLKDRKDAARGGESCVDRKGATHFHCHLNANAGDRKTEEADVLDGNPEAYAPTGCNERLGG